MREREERKEKNSKANNENKSQGPINSLTSAVFSFTLPVFMLLEHSKRR